MPRMTVSSSSVRLAPCASAHAIALAGSATRKAIALAEGPCSPRNAATRPASSRLSIRLMRPCL